MLIVFFMTCVMTLRSGICKSMPAAGKHGLREEKLSLHIFPRRKCRDAFRHKREMAIIAAELPLLH